MPPFITWPTSGAPMGPGFSFRVGTDTPGVPIVGTFWRIKLEGEGGTAPLFGEWRFPTQGLPTLEYYLSSDAFALGSDLIADPRYPQGATIRMQVAITSGGSVVESIEQPVKIDYTSGAPRIITEKQGSISGGFTATDRTALMAINTTVVPWFVWELAGELLPELIEQLRGLVRTKPDRRQVDPDRIGEGFIPPPVTGTFFKWVGIEWAVVEAPPGFGLDDGNPDVTEIDWGQLTRRRAFSDGTSSPDDTFYEKRVNASWYWGLQEPADIAYFIMPGIKVRFWWLIQLEPVVALANPH
jgi:hypothetical protein